MGARTGPGGGEHRGAQARRADAADRPAPRRAGPGGRPARGGVPGGAGRRRGRGPATGRPPRRGQDRVHRLDRGRPADHGRLRRAREARDPRAGGQERQHRVRRRRPGAGGRHRARRRVRQRRPGLLRPVADPGRAVGLRPLHGPAGGARSGGCGWATPTQATTDMGPLISAEHRDAGGVVRARGRPGGVPGPHARRGRILVPADGAGAGATGRPGASARRSSARSWRSCPSTTRRTRSGWPTTRPTGCRARSGPRTWAGRCGWPVASRAATCRSTPTLGAVLDAVRRVQAVGARARARPRRARRVHRGQERVRRHRPAGRRCVGD